MNYPSTLQLLLILRLGITIITVTVQGTESVCQVENNSLKLLEDLRTETSLTFDWSLSNDSSPSDCKTATVCITPANATCQNVSDKSNVTFNGLTPGTNYTASITVTDTNGNTTSDTEAGSTYPAPPATVSATNISTDRISLEITKPTSGIVTGYNICYNSSDGVLQNVSVLANGNVTHNVTSLKPGHQYVFEVFSKNDGDKSRNSTSSGTVTTNLIPPESPEILDVTETTITVAWTNPNANYDVVILNCSGLEGASSATVNITFPVNNGTCEHLTAGALYNITVSTARNDNATSPATSEVLYDVTIPRKPDGVRVYTVNESSINVTIEYNYTELMGQCSSFKIRYQGNGTNTTVLEKTINCSESSVTLIGLETNSLYEVNVSTVSKSSKNVSAKESDVNQTGGWTLPDQVTNLSSPSSGSRWFVAMWSEVDNADSVAFYVLHVIHGNKCVQQILLTVSGSVQNIPDDCHLICNENKTAERFTVSGYNVTDLIPFYSYTYNVTAVNPGGCGRVSEEQEIKTDEDIPGLVRDINYNESSYDINITWLAPEPPHGIITNYTIKWCQSDRVSHNFTTDGECDNQTTYHNMTEFVIILLDAYTYYNISVAAHTAKGQGDFSYILTSTSEGEPYPAVDVMAFVSGPDAIHVNWTLENDAYPTGDEIKYLVTAKPIRASTQQQSLNTTAVGFFNNRVDLVGLEPFINYSVCVRAYTEDMDNRTYWSNISVPCPVAETEEAAPAAVQNITVIEDDICYKMNITWSSPSVPNGIIQSYNVTGQNINDASDRWNDSVRHVGDQRAMQSHTVNVNPNNQSYIITIIAWNRSPYQGKASSQTASSGICSPRSVDPSSVFTNPQRMTKTSFDVEMDRCKLCQNSNGDVIFIGLIIAEDPDDKEHKFQKRDELNKIFGGWDDYNATLGYRTTPDDWKNTINCNISCKGSSTRRRRQVTSDKFSYTVGASDDCAPGSYCNKKLDDSKNPRQFRVRLVMETAGGILVMKQADNVFELKPNKAWIAAPVIICLLLVAGLAVGIVFMYLKRKGERMRGTRTVQYQNGTRNPALTGIDKPSVERPKPVRIENFEEYVNERSKDSDLLFGEEYKLIQELSPKHPHTYAELPNNRLKNRFVNILPYDHSRVKLLSSDDDDESDYINANYIPGYNSKREFIASQGPMKSTVDDFWRMIWEQKVPLIVMLTQLEERGRERCAKYWPSDNEPVWYGDLQVRMRSESVLDSFVIRILDVQLGSLKRTIKQMHFIRWPDFGVPEKPEMLLDFVNHVRIHLPHELEGPILVHCSAGVGRTGSFIAIDRLLQHIKEHDTLDIFSVILEMRNYRCHMIQVEPQYTLIHKCILAAIQRGCYRQTEPTYDDVEENIYENA